MTSSSPRPPAALSARKKSAFALISVLVFMGLVEAATRLLVSGGVIEAASTDTMRSKWAEDGWAVNSLLGWTLIPNSTSLRGNATCTSNSLGLRDHELTVAKPEGEFRVLSVGDSTALGFGVAEEFTYADKTEKFLNGRGRAPVEVINAGVPGYTSTQVRLYLENRGLEFDPDALVIETNFNDRRVVPPSLEPDSAEQFASLHRQLRIRELLDNLTLARVMRGFLSGSSVQRDLMSTGVFAYEEVEIDSVPRVSLAQYEANMREIIRLARERSIEVFLIGLPDDPNQADTTRRAMDLVEEEAWLRAEVEIGRASKFIVYELIQQRLLNQIFRNTERLDRVRQTIPVRKDGWNSTDGYLPVDLADSYIAVLQKLGTEFQIPVLIPRSKQRNIHLDYIHLNRRGHLLVAKELTNAIAKSENFRQHRGMIQD